MGGIPKDVNPIFDTHSHLTLCEKHIDIETHLKECKAINVKYILDPGIDPFDFEEREKKLKVHESVFLGVAIAPHISNKVNSHHFDQLEFILKSGKASAISEIGLEYFHLKDNHPYQKELFFNQLTLAKKYNLPVFLHIRDAMKDAIDIVKTADIEKGVVHCFTGDKQEAKKFLDLGFYLSFSGIVTFKNARAIQESASYTPIEKMLTETDSPYLSPIPHRGKPNKSPHIVHTHDFLANLKHLPRDKFDKQVWLNALGVLNKSQLS